MMTHSWKQKVLIVVFFLAAFCLMGNGLAGAEPPRLELKTMVEKETRVKKKGQGVTERSPAVKTMPGDVLIYTIAYSNAGQAPAVDARIVNPVPARTVLIPESAAGQDTTVLFSTDGGETWQKPPVMMKSKRSGGVVESRPASPEQYTHIQWIVKKPVLPGQSGRVSFRTTVK